MQQFSFTFASRLLSCLFTKKVAVTLAFFHSKPWIISVKVCTLNLNITGPLWLAVPRNTRMICMFRWANQSHKQQAARQSVTLPPLHLTGTARDIDYSEMSNGSLGEDNIQLPDWSFIMEFKSCLWLETLQLEMQIVPFNTHLPMEGTIWFLS